MGRNFLSCTRTQLYRKERPFAGDLNKIQRERPKDYCLIAKYVLCATAFINEIIHNVLLSPSNERLRINEILPFILKRAVELTDFCHREKNSSVKYPPLLENVKICYLTV